jgi:hypothetical protein
VEGHRREKKMGCRREKGKMRKEEGEEVEEQEEKKVDK